MFHGTPSPGAAFLGATFLGATLLALAPALPPPTDAAAEEPPSGPPATLRLDYFHTGGPPSRGPAERGPAPQGTAVEERFSLDRLVVEPLPWPGNPDRPIDDLDLGKYLFEVREADSGRLLYRRGFASIYGEWETTAEAREIHRTFHESLRFPMPSVPVKVVLAKRDGNNDFQEAWSLVVDPADIFVDTSLPPPQELIEIQRRGDPAHKVDLLLLGDGYTAAEKDTFVSQARRLTESLFEVSPFKERRDDFNIWGLCPEAMESGVSRPSTGVHRRSPVGTTYDAFGSERYVLTFDNRVLRDVAAWAPYDFVEILVNNETYGGGGIFGLFSTAAAGNDWAEYLFLHEFGHHFAGLADEYYTSSVAYEIPAERVEPWEVNATVHPQDLKWQDLVAEGVPIPSPWPKQEFEEHAQGIQERRRLLRAENRPEAEMSALFRQQQEFETALLGSAPLAGVVGAFEGASYAPLGTYRPQIDCVMFSRDPVPFCAVCRRGIEQVIDLYVTPGR